MEEMNKIKLEQLKNKYERLEKELIEVKQDLKYVQSGKQPDRFLNTRRTTQKVYILEQPKKQKTNNRLRLETYEFLSGIHVDDMSFSHHPLRSKEGSVVQNDCYQFQVDARINQMKFHVRYVSNHNIEDCALDKIQKYDVHELEIDMMKNVQQAELSEALRYFRQHPAHMGLAMLCLKDYERLYSTRSAIRKQLTEENPGFVNCQLFQGDNEQIYLEMSVGHESAVFFTVGWFIEWNEQLMTVTDKFDIDIKNEGNV